MLKWQLFYWPSFKSLWKTEETLLQQYYRWCPIVIHYHKKQVQSMFHFSTQHMNKSVLWDLKNVSQSNELPFQLPMKHFIFQFYCNEHCALFLVSILPSSFETLLWSALPRLSAPYCRCASMLWETCQPCLDQDPGCVESAWWDSQRPGKHHTSWLKGSMHIHSAITSVTFEQFCLQYAKFHKNLL